MVHRVGWRRNEEVSIIKKKYMDRKLESRGRVERRTTMLDEYVKEN